MSSSSCADNTPAIKLLRKEIRQKIRQQRRALSPFVKRQAAKNLLKSLRQSKYFQHCQHIAIYLTNDGEIDTALLIKDLRRRGKTLYLPVLHPFKTGHLSFIRWHKNTIMRKNRFGILEPAFIHRGALKPCFLELICMPLVAFDEQGNRLGMGGGFYDRTLAFKKAGERPRLIGLAYELQKFEALPYEAWDVPVDAIATEKSLYIFSSKNSHI